MLKLHVGDRSCMSEIRMTIRIQSQMTENRVLELKSKVGARSGIKTLVRNFSNCILEFEIQILDPEHERLVQNDNSGPTVVGRLTQKLVRNMFQNAPF